MMLDHSFLGKTPETLNTVDVDLSLFEPVTMIDAQMLIATEHKRIISSPLIGVDNGASTHLLYCL